MYGALDGFYDHLYIERCDLKSGPWTDAIFKDNIFLMSLADDGASNTQESLKLRWVTKAISESAHSKAYRVIGGRRDK